MMRKLPDAAKASSSAGVLQKEQQKNLANPVPGHTHHTGTRKGWFRRRNEFYTQNTAKVFDHHPLFGWLKCKNFPHSFVEDNTFRKNQYQWRNMGWKIKRFDIKPGGHYSGSGRFSFWWMLMAFTFFGQKIEFQHFAEYGYAVSDRRVRIPEETTISNETRYNKLLDGLERV